MAISSTLWVQRFRTLGIITTLATMLTYAGFRDIHLRFQDERFALHMRIVGGNAESPYRYRVLIPYTAEAVRKVSQLALPGSKTTPFLAAYLLIDFISFLLALSSLYVLLREWFSDEQATIGVLLAAMSTMVALRDHAFQPWSYLEPALLAMGLLAVKQRANGRFMLLTAVASLNRETALLLPLACFAINLGVSGLWIALRSTAASLLVWALVFFGLRATLGPAPHAHSLSEILTLNLHPVQLALATMAWVSFFGVLWIWSAMGFRRAPEIIRYGAAVIPVQVGLVAIWGVWLEVRLMLVLLPIIIPLGLAAVFPLHTTTDERI